METRTISQPKEPKIGLKDYPLFFLIEMTYIRQLKTYKPLQIYLLLTHCWFTYIVSIGVYRLSTNFHDNTVFIINLLFFTQGTLWLLIGWLCKDLVLNYPTAIQKCFCSLRSAGDELFNQLKNECKSAIKIMAFFNYGVTIAATLTQGVYKGDEGNWQITVNIIRTWPNWIRIPILIMHDSVAFIWGFILSFPSAAFMYTTNHIKFQYTLLNSYFEFLIETNGDLYDEIYQELVNCTLKQCVLIHTNILRSTKILTKWVPSFTIMLIASELVTFVASGYFINVGISPKDNIRMYIVLIACLSQVLVFSAYGQFMEDESMKIHTNAYNCPWVNWNKQNRMSLVIIFNNSMKPIQMSKYGIPNANHEIILKLFRSGYAILTFFVNTNKKVT